MKIAVISDSHDNMPNLARFLELAKGQGIEGIIHCGDVTTPETLTWLAENFTGPIKLANGNMEIRQEDFKEVAKRHKNLEVFAEVGEWALRQAQGEIRIAFVHRPDKTEELARTGKYDFVFYGHTHKPWIREVKSSVLVANPGTLGGVFSAPTFAILDTETGRLELKKLY